MILIGYIWLSLNLTQLVEIIEIPEMDNTRRCAEKVCKDMKIKSQNDHNLEEAKKEAYKVRS